MTAHWEFTYGAARVQRSDRTNDFKGSIDFVAQNVRTADFGDPVFPPYVMREVNGVPVAIIGQAFPYTPIANPRHFVPDWTFGIQEGSLAEGHRRGARRRARKSCVLLSHNGMDVDLKLAGRVSPGSTPSSAATRTTACRPPIEVTNAGGKTLVTNAGSNGKFLGVLDLDVKAGRVAGYRYKLLPVFANLLPPDPQMSALIAESACALCAERWPSRWRVTEGLLYRRGNFNGSFDQLILDALMEVQGAQIAFSPGFRWGTTLLPGETITREHLMDQTAITYPYSHADRDDRRDDQGGARRCVRTTCSIPIPTISRAATWCASAGSPTPAHRTRGWAAASATCAWRENPSIRTRHTK